MSLRGDLDEAPKPRRYGHDRTKTYAVFRKLVLSKFDSYMANDGGWNRTKKVYRSFGLETELDFDREVKLFRNAIDKSCDLASQKNAISRDDNPLFYSLRNAFVLGDIPNLTKEINYAFQNFLMRSRFSKNISATHRKIADFRFPYEWFPATRSVQRTIHLHVGPTNSGKTYNALKALENAKSGVYAGPLRLLAHEVYSRFVAKGKPCALVTGEEQRIPENDDLYFRSCTVEMIPLNMPMEVAVIDEIQMIGDHERGWAWTQAVLGVQAKEVHLCGEERSVELIQSLCETIGDKCIVTRYERLSPLEPMVESLGGNFMNLKKGDAVVSFSRIGIHGLKKTIEKATGKRCAIVYGSLPPETRAQQAALFNNQDNEYDFLIASDAIGMGLNLEIKRVIFEQTHKRDNYGFRGLTTSELKQIGGRAGRYRTAAQAIKANTEEATDEDAVAGGPPAVSQDQGGFVTAMDDDDIPAIRLAFSRQPPPLKTAGIQFPPSVLERFSTYFPPNTPLSYIILRLRDIAKLSSRFHMCTAGEMVTIADLIQPYPMSIYDRAVFLSAPVFLREKNGDKVLQGFAKCVSNMEGGNLLDMPDINLELLDVPKEAIAPAQYLRDLEALHKAITLYLWLSYRYSGVFQSQALAFHVKGLVETRIDEQLAGLNINDESRKMRNAHIRKQARMKERNKKKVLGDRVPDSEPVHEGVGSWNEEGHEEPLFQDTSEMQQITRIDGQKEESH